MDNFMGTLRVWALTTPLRCYYHFWLLEGTLFGSLVINQPLALIACVETLSATADCER